MEIMTNIPNENTAETDSAGRDKLVGDEYCNTLLVVTQLRTGLSVTTLIPTQELTVDTYNNIVFNALGKLSAEDSDQMKIEGYRVQKPLISLLKQ